MGTANPDSAVSGDHARRQRAPFDYIQTTSDPGDNDRRWLSRHRHSLLGFHHSGECKRYFSMIQ
jgi:hypothetical protein